MQRSNKYYLDVLVENGGYGDAEKWIEFARRHEFQKVKSEKLYECPSCKTERLSTFAQYIYYSNIFHIKRCSNCGLYFSDTLLPPEIISQHFENAYKDEAYFNQQRKYIFEYIARLADEHTPSDGKVLDIGGGKGHLLNVFRQIRPDAKVMLNDLSSQSCAYGREVFGVDSICCGISDLERVEEKFNTILLIDVMYYEPELNTMFETVNNLLENGQGTLIIRIPNKLALIKAWQLKLRYFGSKNMKFFQNSVKHFNPEHIYIFSKSYMNEKLKMLGFSNIDFMPSPLLYNSRDGGDAGIKALFQASKVINKLSFGRIVLTPSMFIVATR